jgi:hypothetical protein
VKQIRVVFALLALSAVGCNRNRNRPTPSPGPRAAAPAAPRALVAPVEDEAAELINPLRAVSPYPDTAAGLRAMFTELARASAAGDHEQVERLEEQLRLDDDRFALVFTFEGNRQLHGAVVPPARGRLEEKLARLRALGPGAAVTVTGATGDELADGASHGFDPRIAAVRAALRPTVRYFRVEVRGAAGAEVFEPVAFAGGRWVWLAEPWTAVPPTAPVVPGAPPSRAR